MIAPKTLEDYVLLKRVWGASRINFDALDRLDNPQLAYLYYEAQEFRSWASIGDVARLNIIERNIEVLIRTRFLREYIK